MLVAMQSGIRTKKIATAEISSAISSSWERGTSFDPSGWSKSNPAWGQCAVSALVVQDLLGGDLLVGKVNGIDHYWNVLPNKRELDFTRQQFGAVKSLQGPRIITREFVLSFKETHRRYRRLRSKVLEKLQTQTRASQTAPRMIPNLQHP